MHGSQVSSRDSYLIMNFLQKWPPLGNELSHGKCSELGVAVPPLGIAIVGGVYGGTGGWTTVLAPGDSDVRLAPAGLLQQ